MIIKFFKALFGFGSICLLLMLLGSMFTVDVNYKVTNIKYKEMDLPNFKSTETILVRDFQFTQDTITVNYSDLTHYEVGKNYPQPFNITNYILYKSNPNDILLLIFIIFCIISVPMTLILLS